MDESDATLRTSRVDESKRFVEMLEDLGGGHVADRHPLVNEFVGEAIDHFDRHVRGRASRCNAAGRSSLERFLANLQRTKNTCRF